MFARFTGAALRGLLVAFVVAIPSLLLPGSASGTPEIVTLMALVAALLTLVEYNSSYPSIVEFRSAPPLNRLRYGAVLAMVLTLTLIAKHAVEPTNLTTLVFGLGQRVGDLTDFPYSPVRLVVLMLPADAAPWTVTAMRIAAGISYVIALITVALFLFAVRVLGWPTAHGAFNVWTNLPLFDPTAGGDVVHRLQRDGQINVVLGVLLPFAIPAVIKAASELIRPLPFDEAQTMIWVISAWAFLPASMIMRGIAMLRIAALIAQKRRRAYADADAEAAQAA
ncbi:hypothetical protein [Pseudodonghicola flavimaris]|uniref:Uncharacterized protein n=1 Tax=Pseudodonghicola flavimaris TaxID=3050036 RepID=A0ABT7EWG8_9RHOB|nr:hypothetical protein [Pseudodonghicola flavimaris]MDK3016681.1 hypothetical protein [Pseudodonghicola flavimaris]